MAHGGARERSGRKTKYNSPTRHKRVPTALDDGAIDACLRMLEILESKGYRLSEMSLKEIIEAYQQSLNY